MENLDELLRNDDKIYVTVIEKRTAEGKLTPLYFTWEDGVRYKIDEVGEVRRAASTKAGGVGMRYHIRVGDKWNYMWLEDSKEGDRWFMERK